MSVPRSGYRLLAVALATAGLCACGAAEQDRAWTEPVLGMQFVAIGPGEFVMGTPADEPGREAQERQHPVRISRRIWMGVDEVTQEQWQRMMGTNPSHFSAAGSHHPVEQVNWFEVREFLARLTRQSEGNTFRLPTEAEWEYACRAGTTTAYGVGATLPAEAAHVSRAAEGVAVQGGATMPVGSFPANRWGLRDMHGNVWEWTADDYCEYPSDPQNDPRPSCGSDLKVIRGGSWYFAADSARCGVRYTHPPQDRGFSLGFRVVREATRP